MGFLGGGVSSASSSISNSLVFNPIYTVGDGNEADSTARQSATSTATATAKDELGISASVGILGGTGGPAELSRSGDIQPIQAPTTDDFWSNESDKTTLYALGGALVLGGGFYFYNKKKK